jgi:hypothetical protein
MAFCPRTTQKSQPEFPMLGLIVGWRFQALITPSISFLDDRGVSPEILCRYLEITHTYIYTVIYIYAVIYIYK